MMRIAIPVLIVLLAGAGGFFLRWYQPQPAVPLLATDPGLAKYDNVNKYKELPGERYDAAFRVQPAEGVYDSLPAMRIFFDFLDPENYLAAEWTGTRLELGCMQSGLWRILSRRSFSGLPDNVRLKRRRRYIEIVADGQIVLRDSHPGVENGRIATACTAGCQISPPMIQPTHALYFVDDFGRAAGDIGAWITTPGSQWEVRSLDNPARSSNAFVYQGMGEGWSLIGHPFWDRYELEVSVLGTAGGTIGLVAAASSTEHEGRPARYCLFRWHGRGEAEKSGEKTLAGGGSGGDAAGSETPPAGMELVAVEHGQERVLASAPGVYRPGQWYRLRLRCIDGRLRAFVDGREILSASDPAFAGGRAGLYIDSAKPIEFDDFRLLSAVEVVADEVPMFRALASEEDSAGVPWQLYAGHPKPGAPTIAVTGEDDWADMALRARVSDPVTADFGLVVAFRDPGNYLACRISPSEKKQALIQVSRGGEAVLSESAWTPPVSGEIALRYEDGVLRSGGLVAYVPEVPNGRVGAFVGNADPKTLDAASPALPRFTDFRAEVLPPPRGVVSINEVFDQEKLMKHWSGTQGEWKTGANVPKGYKAVYWHRARHYGDCALEALLPQNQKEKWKLALSVCKPEDVAGKRNGYVLVCARSGDELGLALSRDGEDVAAETLDLETDPARLRLRRAGGLLVAYLDDRPVLVWRDPEPLEGSRIAWAHDPGVEIDPAAVQIYSHSVLDYSFNNAPVDWRGAGGVWQVQNRWECDPRWTFMAGMPPYLAAERAEAYARVSKDRAKWLVESLKEQLALQPDPKSRLAAIWHKGAFPGDVTVEAFVGPMMDQKRNREEGHYKHIKNFAITIGGDGESLRSGYACIFGYEDNKKSVILRDGEVVARVAKGIPLKKINIHRNWFRLRVVRRGSTVSFSVYTQIRNGSEEETLIGEDVLVIEDDKPLTGDRVALWTYDSGMVVARVRVSASHPVIYEDPTAVYPRLSPNPFAPAPETVAEGER